MFYNLILLLPCTVCLFWAVLLFCKRKSNARSQNILALYVFLTGISFFILANYLAEVTNYALFYRLDMVDSLITLLIFPLMYLYFKSLTNEGPFSWRDYLWFVPALIVGSSTFILYQSMGKADATGYVQSLITHQSLPPDYSSTLYRLHYLISVQIFNWTLLVEGVFGTTYAVYSLFHYHHRLRNFYSELNDKSINLNYAVLSWFILSLLFILGFILIGGRPFFKPLPTVNIFLFIGWTAIYFGLCYHGSKMVYTVENLAKDLEIADREATINNYALPEKENESETGPETDQSPDKYSQLLGLFNRFIDKEQIFLQSNLRMDDVARMMHTNRTYISRLINEKFQCTFSDYINLKRVEFAQKLMQVNPQMKQTELAEKSGFMSVSSFSRTFRMTTGIPPKEWLKRNAQHT